MSGSTTISSGGGLADRYAAALYAHASDEHALDPTIEQMEALGRLIDESSDFRRLLESPLIDVQTAQKAARAVLAGQGFGKIVQDFVSVIVSNRRLNALRRIINAFAALVAEKRGVVVAEVTTAHPLTDVQEQQLRARLIEVGLRQRQHREAGRSVAARRAGREDRRPAVRQQPQIPPAAPAVRHEGSRLRWRSAPPRSRRS